MASSSQLFPAARVALTPQPSTAREGIPSSSLDAIVTDGTAAAAEINRWALLLGIPFVLSSLFFMAMLATGDAWLVAGSLVTGPGLLIGTVIHLSLSSDTNSD